MRFSINIPNFGDFADPRTVATVAAAAEHAGWDGLFVWDHVVHDKAERLGQPFGDPWMLLTAAALVTSRLKLGTMVTPVARRRPEQLARPVAFQQLQALVEPLGQDDWVCRVAEAAELVLDRPTETGAEDHPSTAEDIQVGHLAGELFRSPPRDRGDHRAQLEA